MDTDGILNDEEGDLICQLIDKHLGIYYWLYDVFCKCDNRVILVVAKGVRNYFLNQCN